MTSVGPVDDWLPEKNVLEAPDVRPDMNDVLLAASVPRVPPDEPSAEGAKRPISNARHELGGGGSTDLPCWWQAFPPRKFPLLM